MEYQKFGNTLIVRLDRGEEVVDRLLELGGERGLALGSDYDGTDVPSWLDGCERVGTLHELIARHFGREVAERVFYENARDFFLRNEQ